MLTRKVTYPPTASQGKRRSCLSSGCLMPVAVCSVWLTMTLLWKCVGDYGSAIETLVTAVSLIKQSKIANDDRCRILISSLQDTLHGIELKSYGSKYSCCILLELAVTWADPGVNKVQLEFVFFIRKPHFLVWIECQVKRPVWKTNRRFLRCSKLDTGSLMTERTSGFWSVGNIGVLCQNS